MTPADARDDATSRSPAATPAAHAGHPLPEAPRFCPRCGHAIEAREGTEGASTPVRCAAAGCGCAWYPDPKVGTGVVVTDTEGRILLVRRNHEVRLDALLGVYSEAGQPVIFVAYAGTIVSGTPNAGDEAFEVGLFDPDALPPLAFDHDDRIVAAWRVHAAARAPGDTAAPPAP